MREQDLKRALGRVSLSEEGRQRIMETSRQRLRRKENPMMKKKKLAFVAIAAVCILTVGAVAAGSAGVWYSSSSARPEYTSLPTQAQMDADVGYHGTAVETFSNGYAFQDANVVRNTLETDGQQEKFKSLSLRYEKDGAQVDLSLDQYSGAEDHEGQPAGSHGGVDLYAQAFVNRVVPEDYVKTQEEVALEQAGELCFACDGSDTVADYQVRSVSWTENGVAYSLTQIDGPLTTDDLMAMAGEIIDAG